MSDRRKLIILWLLVAFAYAAVTAITDPDVIIPETQQRVAYQDVISDFVVRGCDSPGADEPGVILRQVAAENRMTARQLLVIMRRAENRGWPELPCESLPWKPWRAQN